MIEETLGQGVLDSGCTQRVSGELWSEGYTGILPENLKEKVRLSGASSLYGFGDGHSKQYYPFAQWKHNEILGMKSNFLNDTNELSI